MRLGTLLVLAMLLAVPAAALAQDDDDLAPITKIRTSIYEVTTRGSVSVDWSRRRGPVDRRCADWLDESGSATQTFRSRRGRVEIVYSESNRNFPWRFGGQVDATQRSKRTWRFREGEGFNAPGCSGVCPVATGSSRGGPIARAADPVECVKAVPPPKPPTKDCRTRSTRRGSVGFTIDRRTDRDVGELAPIVGLDEASNLLNVTPANFAFYRSCRVYRPELLRDPLPIRLTGRQVSRVRELPRNRRISFSSTRTNVNCAEPGNDGIRCSLDYDVTISIRRVR
jgi:hypothetical protein